MVSKSQLRKLMYPAIISKDTDFGYNVVFPDLLGCVTCGETVEEAYCMAGDALRIWLLYTDFEKGIVCPVGELPKPTPVEEVKAKKGDYVMLVRPRIYYMKAKKGE